MEKEALRQAEGAFPALGGPPSAPAAAAGSAAAGRGGAGPPVLTVDSRTKRVTVGSYVGFSRSRGGLGGEGEEEREVEEDWVDAALSRVLPPPREIEYVRVQRGPATRWVDLKGGETSAGAAAKYVAPPPLPPPGKRHARGNGKRKTDTASGASG